MLFAVASLVGGFAQNEAMLLGSRAAQGLGAAFASPNALALITTTFEPGPKRSRAFAVYAMMSGLGAAVGLLLGGWLTGMEPTIFGTDVEGWRLTFLINVPIGVARRDRRAAAARRERPALAAASTSPAPSPRRPACSRWSTASPAPATARYGWGDTWTITALVVGVVLLVAVRAGRAAAARSRCCPAASSPAATGWRPTLVMMLVPAAMFAMFFFLTLILQNVMGESPMTTGLMFLPFSITMIIAAIVGLAPGAAVRPRQARRRSARRSRRSRCSASAGCRTTTGSASLGVDISYWTDIFPFVVLMPIGMSLVFIPMTMSVVHGVTPADSGIASGVLNTMQQVGGALGLATLSTIALNAATSKADRRSARGSRLRAPRATTRCSRASPSPTARPIGFLCARRCCWSAGVVALVFNRIQPRGPERGEQAVAAH